MKKPLLGLLALVVIAGVVFFITKNMAPEAEAPTDVPSVATDESTELPPTPPTEEEPVKPEAEPTTVLGKSVEGRDIVAYHYGTGDTNILFVGGIHGGYSWNTALVAYELMDYLAENPTAVPENIRVTVIPVLNPDGLYKVVGTDGRFAEKDVPTAQAVTIPGRFNAHTVDLNRNFDCGWQAKGVWQTREVSGGTAAFSEPESAAFKKFVENMEPDAVVVWYSSAGGVFSSNCYNGVLKETATLTNLYAAASGYQAYEEFNFYAINGDMVNWLAKEGYPAISVLLTTHTDVEWDKNRAGVEAVLKHYSE